MRTLSGVAGGPSASRAPDVSVRPLERHLHELGSVEPATVQLTADNAKPSLDGWLAISTLEPKATNVRPVAISLQRGCETLLPPERPMLDTDKAVVVASTLTTAAALLGVLAVYYFLHM